MIVEKRGYIKEYDKDGKLIKKTLKVEKEDVKEVTQPAFAFRDE